VYDSYGKKCNSRFFLNYGFINLNNDANEVPIKVYYNSDDQMKQIKQDMISDHSEFKKFRVVENFEDRVMHEFMSWLRFVEYDENITLIYQYQAAAVSKAQRNRRGDDSDSDDDDPSKGFKAKDLPPLSVRNEKKVLQKILYLAKEAYDKYPRTYEEDMKQLERTDLTFNERNCLLYTSGEKVILNFLIKSC
jgi:protein-histidine N-methyltransferase